MNIKKEEGRNGKGKEYNEFGELIFKGDYINCYRVKGKEYVKGRIEFEGEYIFGNNLIAKDMMKIVI